ncbi:MAG: ion transporter [Gemmatimonadaceae bacterium]
MSGNKTAELERERHRLLTRIDRALETPMAVLGFVWVVLIVLDLLGRLSPLFSRLTYVIWALFILQFVVELIIAPRKRRYLRRQWITAISLLAPAFRLLSVFRLGRALAVMRGARLVRVVGGANRGMRALGRVMERRGFGYVLLLTLVVALAGAAGIYAFERDVANARFESFGTAFWWTAMTLTTMGTDHFPVTPEGRLLTLLLAVYGFAVFGYVTATVASYFVARDAEDERGEIAGARHIAELRRELAGIRSSVDALAEKTGRE